MHKNIPPIVVSDVTNLHGEITIESPMHSYNWCIFQNMSVGAFSHIGSYSWMLNVDIGRYTSIADHVQIMSQQPTSMLTSCPVIFSNMFDTFSASHPKVDYKMLKRTSIGHDVWIGSGTKIKTGVVIGDGAVIGSGSVITKDVPAFSIVAGTPVKLIRMRFSHEIIERIKKLAWWQYDLTKYALSWENIEQTLTELEKLEAEGTLIPYVAPKYLVWRENQEIKKKLFEDVTLSDIYSVYNHKMPNEILSNQGANCK